MSLPATTGAAEHRTILVQHIQTTWTKKSRGMPAAAIRAAVPTHLQMPVAPIDAQIFVHRIVYAERNGFSPRDSVELLDGTRYWSLDFEPSDVCLIVRFTYAPNTHGKPRRTESKTPVLKLAPGQFGVFRINGRFSDSDTGQWWYEQHVVNMVFDTPPSSSLFDSAPFRIVDRFANLR